MASSNRLQCKETSVSLAKDLFSETTSFSLTQVKAYSSIFIIISREWEGTEVVSCLLAYRIKKSVKSEKSSDDSKETFLLENS